MLTHAIWGKLLLLSPATGSPWSPWSPWSYTVSGESYGLYVPGKYKMI